MGRRLVTWTGGSPWGGVAVTENADRIEGVIARLDRWLRHNRPRYYRLLRPGGSAARLDDLERAVGVALPPAFRALYRWRDGQPPDEDRPDGGPRETFCD